MAPRTKRPRSNSSSQAETSSNKSARTNPKPTPHDALWFDDGSIVLATDVHLYRVHKGVLARNSSVFKDMFDFPTSGEGRECADGAATGAEEWDGVPMVKMAGDSDEDVYHLLMALYDREYHQKDKPTTPPIILALLNLSTKYDIPVIRQEVIRHLLIHFPSDQENLDSDVDIPLFDENQETPKDVNFQLLASARRCNAGPILPMLFYTCAIEPLETIFEHITRFETEDFKRLIVGREQLISRWIPLFAKVVFRTYNRCPSDDCLNIRTRMETRLLDTLGIASCIYPLRACSIGLRGIGMEGDYEKLCASCVESAPRCMEHFQRIFWDKLPSIFKLDNWEILEAFSLKS